MCLHTLFFFTFPPSWKEGGQGDGALPHYGAYKRGSPEGSTPLAGGMEDVPPYTTILYFSPFLEGRGPGGWSAPALRCVQAGECRGEHPLWQAVWRMCLQTLHFLTFPPSWKEGGQGDGPRPYRGQSPEPREPSGVWRRGPALRWRWWCPQCMKRGSPEGSTPTGRRYGGCASINDTSLLSPLPSRKGARGMVRAPIEAKAPNRESPAAGGGVPITTVAVVVPPVHEAGSPEGSTSSGRLHGIPRYNEGGVTCLPTADFPGAQRAIFVIGKSQELRIAAATVAA